MLLEKYREIVYILSWIHDLHGRNAMTGQTSRFVCTKWGRLASFSLFFESQKQNVFVGPSALSALGADGHGLFKQYGNQ